MSGHKNKQIKGRLQFIKHKQIIIQKLIYPIYETVIQVITVIYFREINKLIK